MKHLKGRPSRRQDNNTSQHPVAINSWTDCSAKNKNHRKTFLFLKILFSGKLKSLGLVSQSLRWWKATIAAQLWVISVRERGAGVQLVQRERQVIHYN